MTVWRAGIPVRGLLGLLFGFFRSAEGLCAYAHCRPDLRQAGVGTNQYRHGCRGAINRRMLCRPSRGGGGGGSYFYSVGGQSSPGGSCLLALVAVLAVALGTRQSLTRQNCPTIIVLLLCYTTPSTLTSLLVLPLPHSLPSLRYIYLPAGIPTVDIQMLVHCRVPTHSTLHCR